MQEHEHALPIWFFIGALLGVYGILILGAGLYALAFPPTTEVVLSKLHVNLWWGAGMLLLGLIYLNRFWPKPGDPTRKNGKSD
jgi:hypothetical protein